MSNPVTIVMIEDDEGHARLIERNIRRSGINNEIVPFTNGTAAVDYLFGEDGTGASRKGEALLVLLDLNLPDMTGIEAAQQMSAADPTVPLILFTILEIAGIGNAAREAGIRTIVSKSEAWSLIPNIERVANQQQA